MDLVTRLRAEGELPVTGTDAPLCRLGKASPLTRTEVWEPRLQFCAIVITPHCSLQRSLRKSRLRFLELRKSKPKPLGIAPFLPGRSRSRSSSRIWAASRNGARRRPHSASSAATWFSAISRRTAAGDLAPPGSHAFEQPVSNAPSSSKPLSLDPVGQLRQGLHPRRNRRLSLLP